MDDAHAHPLSPVHTIHTRSKSSNTLNLRDHKPNSAHTPKSVPHTRQQRILQTRHSRFPAQRLSVNGMTVPFPHLIRSAENDTSYFSAPRLTKREENGHDLDKDSELTSTSPRSSILNEITNSGAYRIRGIQKRAPIPVFQDSPDKRFPGTAGTNTPSVYHDASSDIQSPSATEACRSPSAAMGLREVSINLHRPSPNKDSPYRRSLRTSARHVSSQGKPRFNSEEYIEHIENELQLVKDAMYSPTTNVHWKEKLRKAKDENDALKKEIEAMKSSFELELQQTVERSTEIEQRLKRRIKDLEDEVDHKQTMILDLEYDREEKGLDQNTLEVLKGKIEKLEEEKFSLETTNRDMMKRNEVLTQLLALSPTKTQHNFELPTPRRRSARPMSMIIPRMPSSPGAHTPLSRPQSVHISPALPASDYFPASVTSSPLASSLSGMVNDYPATADDAQSIDSSTGKSSSHMTDGTGSRRSTLASCVATSPSRHQNDRCQPDTRPHMPTRQPSKRRPRKFMPGSTQLKPLLLPTFTAENGNLPSTSPVTSPRRPVSIVGDYGLPYTPQWASPPMPPGKMESLIETQPLESYDTSNQDTQALQSLDEVFERDRVLYCNEAFHEATVAQSDQCHHSHNYASIQSSPVLAVEEAHSQGDPWGLGIKDAIPVDIEPQYDKDCGQAHLDDAETSASGPLRMLPDLEAHEELPQPESGLQTLEQHVEIPRPLFSRDLAPGRGAVQSPSYSADGLSPLNPRKRRKAGSTSPNSLQEEDVTDGDVLPHQPVPRPTLTPASVMKRKADVSSSQSLPPSSRKRGANRARSPLEILHQRHGGARPLAAITIQTIYATLSKYTSYIRAFKRDPLALARRVIANAWRSNWAMFGKLSWWVLGLFIGHGRPRPEQHRWDWEVYDGESIADRHCGPGRDRISADGGSIPAAGESAKTTPQHEGSARATEAAPPDAHMPRRKRPKTGWGTSLFLWGKFSVAIMLAVGGAIVKGPAEMLRETEERRRSRSNSFAGSEGEEQDKGVPQQSRRFGEDEQVLWPDFNQDSEENPPPDTTRKARSFSSPTLPTRYSHFGPLPPYQGLDNGASNEVSTILNSEPCTKPHHPESSFDDTLKPIRTDRNGIGSLFDPPSGKLQSLSTTRESQVHIKVAADQEDEERAQHSLENG